MVSHNVWAYSEKPALLAELIKGARLLAEELGGSTAVALLGPRVEAEKIISLGADKVFWLGEKEDDTLVEDYVPTLVKLLEEHKPAALMVGATKRGKAVAGRVAANLGVSAITDAKEFVVVDGKLSVRHMIFGGGAMRFEKSLSDETMLTTVGLGMYEVPVADAGRKGEIVEVPFVEPAWRVKFSERREKKVTTVNLAAAKRVVCPGRGVGKQEDMAMISELAQELEAEIGCTRPLAEGLDWLPRETYIGVSGAFIKPELYIGIGVSGQVQHTIGVTDSRVIVAINKDKNASIFKQADYGIVGDLCAVVPALIKGLKARK
jgi:electron transfer flavoprotein alpha subunit